MASAPSPTILPKIEQANKSPPPSVTNFEPPNKSILVIRRELSSYVSNTLEEARDRDSWAHQKLMHTLKEYDTINKVKKQQSSRGQSFISDNKLHAIGRHSPTAKQIILFNNSEKGKKHANVVVERRNQQVANKLFQRIKHTSHHHGIARQRNEKLTSWVFEACAMNQKSVKMRWLVALSIGSRMQALRMSLNRSREKEKALNMFGSIALMSAKVNALALRRRQRIAADRLIAFLNQTKANDSLWARCQGQVKRSIIRVQRRFRSKLQCHLAHVELVKQQYRRNVYEKEYDSSSLPASAFPLSSSSSSSSMHKQESFPDDSVFRSWVHERCRQQAVAVQNWENFEVWPVVKATLEEKPWLVMLDLHDKQTWISPPRTVVASRPSVLPVISSNTNNLITSRVPPSPSSPTSPSLSLTIDMMRFNSNDSKTEATVSVCEEKEEKKQQKEENTENSNSAGGWGGGFARRDSINSVNTPEQALSAHRRWGLLKNAVAAGSAFEEAGSSIHSSSSIYQNSIQDEISLSKRKHGRKPNTQNNEEVDDYDDDDYNDDDSQNIVKVKIPLREEFALSVRSMYRMFSFLLVYGDVRQIPPKPRLERLMTDRELLRFQEAQNVISRKAFP